ncbi:MAG: DUF3090 family protein, partial [Nitriliruptoraceae bacterium]
PATDWDRTAMALRAPIEPAWQVGDIGVGIDEATGQYVLELHRLTRDADDPADVLRVAIDVDQARRFVAHAVEQVGEGRRACPLCGRPMASDGSHVCPSTNGHGTLTQ